MIRNLLLPSEIHGNNDYQKIIPIGFGDFCLIIFITIIFNYLAPPIIKDLWYFFVLYLYYRSRDEAFWLVFFLVLNDGFVSFFGYKSANIDSIPFLAQFEVGHLYIFLALYKVIRSKYKIPVFFSNFMVIMLLYIILLYFYGLSQGIPSDYNIHLRNLRLIIPLLLIYTTPSLLRTVNAFERFFSFTFLIAILAFLTQVFSIVTGISPIALFGITEVEIRGVREVGEEVIYRALLNVSATLISFFAAMFYTVTKIKVFDRRYLQFVLFSAMGTGFLSATRGWILGLGLSFILYLIIVNKTYFNRFLRVAMPVLLISFILLLHPRLNQQVSNAWERFKTVEYVLEGDLSAGGTASRATVQGPAVLSVWEGHPVIGWGYSDTFYKNQNGHVGNENVLLHSGILGAGLMVAFFIYFHLKLVYLPGRLSGFNPYGKAFLVFPIFFVALFIIHSTSGQLFGYMTNYRVFFMQAVFFGFGAAIYNQVILIRGLNLGYNMPVK